MDLPINEVDKYIYSLKISHLALHPPGAFILRRARDKANIRK